MTLESSNPAPRSAHCEVFVLGGGPAGSTAAALLAERGRDVVIVEKERHPRFHIGESLLPLNLPLFEKLGVGQKIRAISMPKYGAEFTSPHHDTPVTFEFAQAWDKGYELAYQVRRSEFDQILFENCVEKGARAYQECQVTDVDIKEDGVHRAQPLMRQFDRTVRHGVKNFSWFIYRMTSPAIRKLFMAPANPLRMQEALLSLLAGDLFRGTPIHWSLRAFKGLYYITSLLNLRSCLAAWRRRKQAIRDIRTESASGSQV